MADIPTSDITELFPNKSEDEAQKMLRHKLSLLNSEHRDLDEVIARLSDASLVDQLQLKRLKKRKLNLKDEITRLHAKILPDIIA